MKSKNMKLSVWGGSEKGKNNKKRRKEGRKETEERKDGVPAPVGGTDAEHNGEALESCSTQKSQPCRSQLQMSPLLPPGGPTSTPKLLFPGGLGSVLLPVTEAQTLVDGRLDNHTATGSTWGGGGFL